jgi:hypothetical protein
MWSSVHFSLLAVGHAGRRPLASVTHGWTIEVIRAGADGVLGQTSSGRDCRRTNKITGTLSRTVSANTIDAKVTSWASMHGASHDDA